ETSIIMSDSLTEGAHRALHRAQARAQQRGGSVVEPADLLAALTDEPECRAAVLLSEFGLDIESAATTLGLPVEAPDEPTAGHQLPHSVELRAALADAAYQARSIDRGRLVGTEHLLAALLSTSKVVAEALTGAGLELPTLLASLADSDRSETE